MKSITTAVVISLTFLTACNNNNTHSTVSSDSVKAKPVESKEIKAQDTKTPSSIKGIFDGYLLLKNALAEDNGKDAASAGNMMVEAFGRVDTKALTPEKKKTFEEIADDAREHAEHIGKNGGNIKHQREHFDMLSQDIYQLAKTFGAGQTLYFDHCPMYNDKKGADWLSETKEIKNPYLGKEMPTCGTLKEELN